MINGLTAKWGTGGTRPPIPPALRTALVAWYNTEIQRVINFDIVESYLLDFNAGVLHPENATATASGQKLRITNEVNTVGAIYEVIASVAGAELVLNVKGLSSTIRARAGTLIGSDYVFYPLTNGVNKIPGAASGSTLFFVEGLTVGACDITIEQLPTSKLTDLSGNGHHLHLYGYTGTPTNGINADGWLQSASAGYGVSYGQPILTDYTACSTRKWNTTVPAWGAFASKNSKGFIMERTDNSVQYSYSFNAKSPITFEPGEFTYQSSASYNGTPITKGTNVDDDTLILGRLTTGSGTRFDGSYKSFVLFNRTLTTEELAYVKQWMS